MKLLIDMNLSPAWVPFLNRNDISAVHWSTLGPASAKDSEIMDFAAANGLVVFTHDLDFGTMLAARKASGPSVIQIRSQDILPEAIGALVLRSLNAVQAYLDSGALVTIEPGRHRIRLLPM